MVKKYYHLEVPSLMVVLGSGKGGASISSIPIITIGGIMILGLGGMLVLILLGWMGGVNTYGYVGGDPVRRIDPLGLVVSPDIVVPKPDHLIKPGLDWLFDWIYGTGEAIKRAGNCKKALCGRHANNDLISTECMKKSGKDFRKQGEYAIQSECKKRCYEALKDDDNCNDPTEPPIPSNFVLTASSMDGSGDPDDGANCKI